LRETRQSNDSSGGGMAEEFDLERFLPYLLNQAAEAASRSFAQAYRTEYGLTRTQWRVLANLGRFGAMTASDICHRSHLEKTKVSRAVATLEGRGWLRRAASSEDRRAEILTLTDEGQDLFRRLGTLAMAYDQQLRDRLGPTRAEAVVEVLGQLRALCGGPDDDPS
jgi:DNA-binding MarR family transcriptional regulator